MKTLKTSVVICGAGPAGLTLAHLLGQQDIDVVLIEKLDSTMSEPRAIAIDGESLRTLQHIGLLDGFKDELLSGIKAKYTNGDGIELFEMGERDTKPYGHPTVNSFDQPTLDRYLADALERRHSVTVLWSTRLDRFEQDGDGITAYCHGGDNEELVISADYLVGCDGGRSLVRSQLGIQMSGESNPLPWLVIDTIDPHLENTMDCQFFCDPRRPGMTIKKRHGERRWEWMLMPGEDREYLLDDANIKNLISPYTDVESVNIYRKRVYDFHAIIAERWQEGRVFIAGDAAHMTPPFAGQGLNSGFRDVTNIFWKLAAVVKGKASSAILESYETERRDHAWSLIETALALGAQIQPIDQDQAKERDAFFAELQKDPAALEQLEDDMSASLLLRDVGDGLAVDMSQDSVAGKLLIQPLLETAQGDRVLLDDMLGDGFSIVGFGGDPQKMLSSETLEQWSQFGAGYLHIAESTVSSSHADVIDAHAELAEWLGTETPVLLLLRPDKFVMAVAAAETADDVFQKAYRMLAA